MTDESVPLEYQLFGLAFSQEGAITYFAEQLPVHDVGTHGQFGLSQFYKALIEFHNKTGLDPINPIAFKSWLASDTEISDALGGSDMVDLFVDTMINIEKSTPQAVVATLRLQANKKRSLDYAQELHQLLTKKGKADPTLVTDLTDRIRNLQTELGKNPYDRVVTANDIALHIDNLWEIPEFLPTQFKSLNKALGYTEKGGFFKGAVHALIAQSGKGKSTMAKSLVNHWLDEGHRVLFINYEEPQALWERVLLTQITKTNVYYGIADDSQKAHLEKVFTAKMKEWGDRLMVRHDPDTPFFEDLESWLRDLIGHGGEMPDVVVIDTIQSLFTKGKSGVRWGQYEEMMVRFEKLARDMKAAFILTAQENGNRMKDGREVVMQTDTGGSIAIQQKCAVTIFITERRNAAKDDSIDQRIMQLQIPKNRITGTTFHMDPPLVKYNDDIKLYEPWELDEHDLNQSSVLLGNTFKDDF